MRISNSNTISHSYYRWLIVAREQMVLSFSCKYGRSEGVHLWFQFFFSQSRHVATTLLNHFAIAERASQKFCFVVIVTLFAYQSLVCFLLTPQVDMNFYLRFVKHMKFRFFRLLFHNLALP